MGNKYRRAKRYKKLKMEDYTYKVNDDNSFTIYYLTEEVYTSRVFRLRTQAEGKAMQFIKDAVLFNYENGITLDVQNLSTDLDTLFRRL